MAPKWTLAELTELDLRLHRPQPADHDILPVAEMAELSRSTALHRWLEAGRSDDPDAARFADTAIRSISWLTLSLSLFSLLSGISAAAALLRFGKDPLMNVSSYLGLLIGVQLLALAGTLLSAFLFRRHIPALQKMLLPRQVSALTAPVSLRAWRWRIFSLFQTAGILFNAGILLMTLGKGITHDLAFGWATTLEVTGESVHGLVRGLSLPWGGTTTPSLEEILNSRILHAADAGAYSRAATASWWPFIMMCVLVYGLLPRFLLRFWGGFQLGRVLKNPALDSPDCERLYLSLTRKTFSFSGNTPNAASSGKPTGLPDAFLPEKPLRLLVDAELVEPERLAALKKEILGRLEIRTDPEAAGVLKVAELWQPPLEETLRELRELRRKIGPEGDLLILGVGFPAAENTGFFQPPAEADLNIWRRRLGELNDPHLGVIPWRSH